MKAKKEMRSGKSAALKSASRSVAYSLLHACQRPALAIFWAIEKRLTRLEQEIAR